MKNRKYLFICLLQIILITISCKSKDKFCTSNQNLILINKAEYCFSGLKSKKLEKKESKWICERLNHLSLIEEEVSVNVNYGFIEVQSDKDTLFFVIFSDLNGLIIRYNGKHYNGDEFISKIMKMLNMNLKKNSAEDCLKIT